MTFLLQIKYNLSAGRHMKFLILSSFEVMKNIFLQIVKKQGEISWSVKKTTQLHLDIF